VGIPLGLAALAFLGLYLNERRLRKGLQPPSAGPARPYKPDSPIPGPDTYPDNRYEYELNGAREPVFAELGGNGARQ
jgi:hypothetical protein